MKKNYIYMVIDKKSNTRWGVSDSFEKFIPICKYLLKNIKNSDTFTVVWSDGERIKEKNFKEFCELQEIV